jgi:hypothetical protein
MPPVSPVFRPSWHTNGTRKGTSVSRFREPPTGSQLHEPHMPAQGRPRVVATLPFGRLQENFPEVMATPCNLRAIARKFGLGATSAQLRTSLTCGEFATSPLIAEPVQHFAQVRGAGETCGKFSTSLYPSSAPALKFRKIFLITPPPPLADRCLSLLVRQPPRAIP